MLGSAVLRLGRRCLNHAFGPSFIAEKKDEGLLNPTRGCLARRGQFLVSRLFESQGIFSSAGVRRVDVVVPPVAVPLLDPQAIFLLHRLPVNRNDTRKVEIGMITS